MTEEGMKTKWCPMVRVVRINEPQEARDAGLGLGSQIAEAMPMNAMWLQDKDETTEISRSAREFLCIGSACAMFRHVTFARLGAGSGIDMVENIPTGDCYCGLAGHP